MNEESQQNNIPDTGATSETNTKVPLQEGDDGFQLDGDRLDDGSFGE